MAIRLNWPALLTQGKRYRGRIQLSGMEAAFASRGAVESRFAELGFALVRALKPSEIRMDAASWPTQLVQDKGAWYVEGVWSRTSMTVKNPSQDKLVEAWEV